MKRSKSLIPERGYIDDFRESSPVSGRASYLSAVPPTMSERSYYDYLADIPSDSRRSSTRESRKIENYLSAVPRMSERNYIYDVRESSPVSGSANFISALSQDSMHKSDDPYDLIASYQISGNEPTYNNDIEDYFSSLSWNSMQERNDPYDVGDIGPANFISARSQGSMHKRDDPRFPLDQRDSLTEYIRRNTNLKRIKDGFNNLQVPIQSNVQPPKEEDVFESLVMGGRAYQEMQRGGEESKQGYAHGGSVTMDDLYDALAHTISPYPYSPQPFFSNTSAPSGVPNARDIFVADYLDQC